MRSFSITLVLFLIVLILPAQGIAQNEQKSIKDPSKDQWIIVMRDPRSERRKHRATGIGYVAKGNYNADPKLARISKQFSKEYALNVITQWPIKSLNVHCLVVTLPENTDSEGVLNKIREDNRVEAVQPMNSFDVLASQDDPYQKMQPALNELATEEAHRYATGAGVTIAIIDSAIDTEHPDLDGVVLWQENLVDEKNLPLEKHGTGIAGVIAARSNNGIGIKGVAPDAKVYGLRACWQNKNASSKARCNTLTLSRALDRVIDEKPLILNLSLSGPNDPLLQRLLALITAQNTIVVSAYDEIRKAEQRFPQPQTGVLYARGGDDVLTQHVKNCFPAPAHDVLTLQPSDSYDVMTGNSLAAAHLSGAIALLLEANPNLNIEQVRKILLTSVVKNKNSASINACKALKQVDSQVNC